MLFILRYPIGFGTHFVAAPPSNNSMLIVSWVVPNYRKSCVSRLDSLLRMFEKVTTGFHTRSLGATTLRPRFVHFPFFPFSIEFDLKRKKDSWEKRRSCDSDSDCLEIRSLWHNGEVSQQLDIHKYISWDARIYLTRKETRKKTILEPWLFPFSDFGSGHKLLPPVQPASSCCSDSCSGFLLCTGRNEISWFSG